MIFIKHIKYFMKLSKAVAGREYIVKEVLAVGDTLCRLQSLGVNSGASIFILFNCNGRVVIIVGHQEIGLCKNSAEKIIV